ncbi:MAG: sulfate adenylyltransferase subunit CysN [Treponemataceae bacterium]|nr:sulfate adenylyltransferase subunit CysN [Treponemataceae bacterium]
MNGLLKFITCGSVDDGKSTLIGHILYDAKLLYTDQEEALALDSKVGSREGKIDYSLLLDGLMAEREQGITIDVAYRYFNTEKRSFIVADTPGHEEYTRNMAVGASFADLAIILVDAKQGVLVQTRRHSRICSLMGIKHFIFAVNKMDLVGYSEKRFSEVTSQIQGIVTELGLQNIQIIPVSATEGDNVTKKSENMKWYNGPTILSHLEDVDISDVDETNAPSNSEKHFFMPIQRVCRPNHEFRGFQGQIEGGIVNIGDEITTLPSGEKARVKKIIRGFDEVQSAQKGQAVNIALDREVDVSRGCVFEINENLKLTNKIEATLLWMDDSKLETGKNFFIKLGTKQLPAIVSSIKYAIDVNSGEHKAVTTLSKNEIAVVDISFSDVIIADEFKNHKVQGELILIDRITNMTSACGVVTKVHETDGRIHTTTVNSEKRASLKGQRAKVFKFMLGKNGVTGEILHNVEKHLYESMRHTYLYTPVVGEDYANVVKILVDAGLIVLLALDEHVAVDEKLKSEKFYVSSLQENLTKISVDDVTEQIKKQTSVITTADDYSI